MQLHSAIAAFAINSDLCDELTAGFGIDLQAAIVTPTTKFFGLDDDALDGISPGNRLLLGMYGFFEPGVIRPGEVFPVGHDADRGVILFGCVPAEGQEFDGVSHG